MKQKNKQTGLFVDIRRVSFNHHDSVFCPGSSSYWISVCSNGFHNYINSHKGTEMHKTVTDYSNLFKIVAGGNLFS